MTELIDSIFRPLTFLILNVAIIVSAEFVGGGTYFFNTGLIHAIAIFFIILAALRISLHYYSYDAILEKFIHGAIFAFILLALSHVVEFLSYEIFHMGYDATFANVTNFYAASLLAISMGAEQFLMRRDRRKPYLVWTLFAGILLFLSISVSIFFNNKLISLEIENPAPFIYAVVTSIVALFAIIKVRAIGKATPYSQNFTRYLTAAIVLILIAVFPGIFYDQLGNFNVNNVQIIYLSHFIFYAALSLMFLAFRTFSYLGGVYEDVKKAEKENAL